MLNSNNKGFYLDAEAAISYLYGRNDIDKAKIILYGQSIGGAVAIHTGMAGVLVIFPYKKLRFTGFDTSALFEIQFIWNNYREHIHDIA